MEKFNAETLYAMISGMTAEVTIGKRAEDGDAKTFQVHVKDMVLPAIEKCLRYGIQRSVNDPVGGKDKTLADKIEMAEDIILSFYSGEFRVRKNAAPKLDDFAKFARSWLLAKIKPAYVAKHGKESWKDKTEGEAGAAFIQALVLKNAERFKDEITAAYKVELAAREKAAKIADEVDLDI